MSGQRISAIVPVFNCERYLGAALDSIVAQQPPVDEIVVVDDGSTDGSAAVARSHAAGVRYVRQDNAGIGAARNLGLRESRGELIAWLDSDDLWMPGKIALQLAVLESEPAVDLVFGQVEQFVSDDIPEEDRRRIHCPAGLQPGFVAGSMLARRSALERVDPYDTDLHVGEFVAWFMRAQELGVVHRVLPDLVLRRRLHRTNQGVLQRQHQLDYVRVVRAALQRRRAAGQARDDDGGGA